MSSFKRKSIRNKFFRKHTKKRGVSEQISTSLKSAKETLKLKICSKIGRFLVPFCLHLIEDEQNVFV